MKVFDLLALGEVLIDFTDNGLRTQGNTLFEANPRGAPCNSLPMLNKSGHKLDLIEKLDKISLE